MAIAKLSIGEVNSGPFNAIDSVIDRINAAVSGTLSGADVVENVAAIVDPATADAEAVATKVNELIAALITAGVMEAAS